MRYDAVVIGSGVSGMASALALAREGLSVAIVEANRHPAPLIRRFRRRSVWCDAGFHYFGGLTDGGGAGALFRYLGLFDRLNPEPLDSNGFDTVAFEGEPEVRLPVGLDRTRQTLKARFPGSADAVDAWIDAVASIQDTIPFANLSVDPGTFDPRPNMHRSLGHLLAEAGAEPDLVRFLDAHGYLLHGTHIDETPLHVHGTVIGFFLLAAHTFPRGGDTLADGFGHALKTMGVPVFTRTRANAIRSVGRSVAGIEVQDADGNHDLLECAAAVSAIHPKRLIQMLEPSVVRPAYLQRVRKCPETFPPFVLYFDAPNVPESLLRTNHYYVRPDRKSGRDEVLALMARPSDVDPETGSRRSLCAVREASGWEAVLRDPSDSAYAEWKEAMTADTVAWTGAVVPELRGRCETVAAATPRTYEREAGAFLGSVYGIRHAVGTEAVLPLGPLRGLFLAGQSVGMPGVLGAMISGVVAAAAIVGWNPIMDRIRRCA